MWVVPEDPVVGSSRILVEPMPDALPFCCLSNCEKYTALYGGEIVEGCYVLKHNMLQLYQLVRHFIVNTGTEYIDPTPFDDCRSFNTFIPVKIGTYNLFVESLENINTREIQETHQMYYVYCYIDPLTNEPMYVGKGKQDRAYAHMRMPRDTSKNKTRFKNKLEKLKQGGVIPIVVFLAQNIQDEEIAYQIEESFIQKYGRLGYDEGGILLNVCLGSRPPNHKNRTYQEIYGDRAEEQRLKRKALQEAAGGWFRGRKHSDASKAQISAKVAGTNSKSFSGITESMLLDQGKAFCEFFNNAISSKKWKWWCSQNNIPTLRKTFRFEGQDIFEVFTKAFGASIKFDSMLWFHNPLTNKVWRCFDWEIERGITSPPPGFIRGRGKGNFVKQREKENV